MAVLNNHRSYHWFNSTKVIRPCRSPKFNSILSRQDIWYSRQPNGILHTCPWCGAPRPCRYEAHQARPTTDTTRAAHSLGQPTRDTSHGAGGQSTVRFLLRNHTLSSYQNQKCLIISPTCCIYMTKYLKFLISVWARDIWMQRCNIYIDKKWVKICKRSFL